MGCDYHRWQVNTLPRKLRRSWNVKKMTNRLLSLGLVLIAVAVLTIPVLAADAVVRRDGTSGLVIETTGSG